VGAGGLSDGGLAFLRSDARTRRMPYDCRLTGAPHRWRPTCRPTSVGAPGAANGSDADCGRWHADSSAAVPSTGHRAGQRHPAAIFFHGGSRRQMLLGYNYGEYYHNAYALNQYLASRGFVVLSVNYRSGIGYGLNFREAERYGASGASEFNDVVGAGMYLRGATMSIRPGGAVGRLVRWLPDGDGAGPRAGLFATGVDIRVHDWNVGIRTFVPDFNTCSTRRGPGWRSSHRRWRRSSDGRHGAGDPRR
jgi:hypothetical protein